MRAELAAQSRKRHKPKENNMSFQFSAPQTTVHSIDAVQIAAIAPQKKKSFDWPKAIDNGLTYLMFILIVAAAPIPIYVFAKMLYLELAKLSIYQLMHLI